VNESLLDIHDGLLLQQPDGARHDGSLCPFCTDWAMSESGTPSGFDRLDLADRTEPYGPVEYADPGLQEDKVKRYPIDTEAHATAAWTYVHQASNAKMYSEDDLVEVRTRISKALEKFQSDAEDKELEKTKALAEAKNAGKPAVAAPAKKPASSTPKKTDAASEGGTTKHMDTDISKETHEALLDKAVRDAVATLTTERDTLKAQVETLSTEKASLTENFTAVKAENERLNGDLDTAQVSLKAASDEAAALKADMAAKDAEAEKTQIASDRAAQVRNLGLFPEEYIADKASKWASVDEASWTDRLDEWKALKGTTATSTTTTDTASALTGTREGGTGHEPSARRAILGLA
jgi:regulator of replication initiation timing